MSESNINPYVAPTSELLRPLTHNKVNGPVGFGGWLLLPLILAIIRPFALLAIGLISFVSIMQKYNPMWKSLLIYKSTTNTALLIFSVIIVIMFFRKSILAPKMYTIYICIVPFLILVDMLLFVYIPEIPKGVLNSDASSLVLSVISAMIWSMYFNGSIRVKNTFIRIGT